VIAKRELATSVLMGAIGVGVGLLWPLDRRPAGAETATIGSDDPTGGVAAREGRSRRSEMPALAIRVPSLVSEPGAPGYDATRLVRRKELRLGEVFDLEPRDDAFAAQRELDLADALRSALDSVELVAGVDDIAVECHTASCVARLSMPAPDAERTYNALTLFPVGDMVTPHWGQDPEDAERAIVNLTIVYAPEHLDHGAFRSWYEDLLWKKGLTVEQGMPGLPASVRKP